ncbi:hypothetical protein BU15DRAFT_78149 [Melanogaster broomeanus]|nr:hypothetical protein BU15DRAFT_78149 [Melanogaster broomeanus]
MPSDIMENITDSQREGYQSEIVNMVWSWLVDETPRSGRRQRKPLTRFRSALGPKPLTKYCCWKSCVSLVKALVSFDGMSMSFDEHVIFNVSFPTTFSTLSLPRTPSRRLRSQSQSTTMQGDVNSLFIIPSLPPLPIHESPKSSLRTGSEVLSSAELMPSLPLTTDRKHDTRHFPQHLAPAAPSSNSRQISSFERWKRAGASLHFIVPYPLPLYIFRPSRSIEELEAPDFRHNASTDLIRQRAAEKERNREASQHAKPGTIKRMQFTFSLDHLSPVAVNVAVSKPDLKPSAAFKETITRRGRPTTRANVAGDEANGCTSNTHIETETSAGSQKRKNFGSSSEQLFLRFPIPHRPLCYTLSPPSPIPCTMGRTSQTPLPAVSAIIRPTIELPLDELLSTSTLQRTTTSHFNSVRATTRFWSIRTLSCKKPPNPTVALAKVGPSAGTRGNTPNGRLNLTVKTHNVPTTRSSGPGATATSVNPAVLRGTSNDSAPADISVLVLRACEPITAKSRTQTAPRQEMVDVMVGTAQCYNCHTTATPLWRKDDEGKTGLVVKRHDLAVCDNNHIHITLVVLQRRKPQFGSHRDAGLHPSQADFVELHGMGTVVGDATEVNRAGAVFAEGRDGRDVLIGSVESNVGHGCAYMTSLVKVVMMLENKQVLPKGYFKKPSSRIDFAGYNLGVPVAVEDFIPGEPNSAGGHTVPREHEPRPSLSENITLREPLYLFAVGGLSVKGCSILVDKYKEECADVLPLALQQPSPTLLICHRPSGQADATRPSTSSSLNHNTYLPISPSNLAGTCPG